MITQPESQAETPPPSRLYYVTMRRDSKMKALVGPWPTLADASRYVEPARNIMVAEDPRCHFDSFGVTSGVATPGKAVVHGRLNGALGVRAGQS